MALELVKGNKVTYTLECRRGKNLEQSFAVAAEIKGTLKLSSKDEIDPVDIEITSPSSELIINTPETGFIELTFLSERTNLLIINELYDLALQLKETGGDFIEWNEPRAVKIVKQIITNA